MRRSISGLVQLQKKAQQLAVNLRKEIRSKETELGQLKGEERKLSALVGGPAAAAGMAPVPRGGRARINWGAALEEMPREFTASEVHRVRGLKR